MTPVRFAVLFALPLLWLPISTSANVLVKKKVKVSFRRELDLTKEGKLNLTEQHRGLLQRAQAHESGNTVTDEGKHAVFGKDSWGAIYGIVFGSGPTDATVVAFDDVSGLRKVLVNGENSDYQRFDGKHLVSVSRSNGVVTVEKRLVDDRLLYRVRMKDVQEGDYRIAEITEGNGKPRMVRFGIFPGSIIVKENGADGWKVSRAAKRFSKILKEVVHDTADHGRFMMQPQSEVDEANLMRWFRNR